MICLFALTLGAQSAFATQALRPDEAQELAIDAYTYAYPLVLMEISRQVATHAPADLQKSSMYAPMNHFAHLHTFPDASFDAVVRPNADTLYSSLWFDVSREPLIVKVADSGGRYFLLPMLDMWTDVFSSPGTRTSGNAAQTFAIAGPNWQGTLPAGVALYRSPTAIGWMIGRVQTNGVADYQAVARFQAGLSATPLSAWGKPALAALGADQTAGQDMHAPVDQVEKMPAAAFFALFARLLKDNPPHADDYPMIDRLARVGLVPGRPFDVASLPATTRQAFETAPVLAQKTILLGLRRAGALVHGWRMPLNPIGTYGTDYLRRALIAYAGLGANTIEDAIYPTALADADGKPLDSAARYVLHFEKDQLPPVRAFWSLTMYNERQFFTANPINRFAIGDRDALTYNADGSLDLYVQRDAPSGDKRANWLPAPAKGGFTMNMRLYWPTTAALHGDWAPPAIQRLP
ncbi:MAG: DUF1254 domain-containing protein [Pseudomonadota bacterium]